MNISTKNQQGGVTAGQVNAFVRERLSRDNRASLIYVPKEQAEMPPQDDLAMAEAP